MPNHIETRTFVFCITRDLYGGFSTGIVSLAETSCALNYQLLNNHQLATVFFQTCIVSVLASATHLAISHGFRLFILGCGTSVHVLLRNEAGRPSDRASALCCASGGQGSGMVLQRDKRPQETENQARGPNVDSLKWRDSDQEAIRVGNNRHATAQTIRGI